ncbi:hypothetical protein [Nocardiopsis sp. Huas11]|uniref:hypothetical protein n=1 Tax=Nocardiopsis sp. Huas11 TaxID=2183912 RepID=UPI0011C3C356|nr:hypothetical protein [Nocardiopsis sp. Huas11]
MKQLDIATPVIHTVAEAIADVVDPDGCYCWLKYDTIAQRAKHASRSAAERSVKTLCEYKVTRKITGARRFEILDAMGASYERDKPPTVLELLIPASAYGSELARINLMRADRGRPPITPESRPDITGLIGELPKSRSDKDQPAPQRRKKDVREAEKEFKEQQPSLYSAQDLEGPPEDPHKETGTSLRRAAPRLSDVPPHVSQTYNPGVVHPSDADPDSIPSVGGQPQEASPQVSAPDGADFKGAAQQDEDQGVRDPGGDAARPAEPAAETPVPPSPAELVVDQLLAETARLGADPLGDPAADRRRLVAMAQAAIDAGMAPARLREIASVGLHNVRRQWALATRLADPEAFASVRQGAFGGVPMGGPALGPLCVLHPGCTAVDAQGRCAECGEAERVRALSAGEVVEYTRDADGVWRDHTGAPAAEGEEFAGLSEAEIADEMATRERMRTELEASRVRAREQAAALRAMLAKPREGEVEGSTVV